MKEVFVDFVNAHVLSGPAQTGFKRATRTMCTASCKPPKCCLQCGQHNQTDSKVGTCNFVTAQIPLRTTTNIYNNLQA